MYTVNKISCQITGSEIDKAVQTILDTFKFGTVLEGQGVWMNPDNGQTCEERSVRLEYVIFKQGGDALNAICTFAKILGDCLGSAGEHSALFEVWYNGKYNAWMERCEDLGSVVDNWACPF